MKGILLQFILLLTIIPGFGQINALMVQKKHKTVLTYYEGRFITLETIDKSYAEGLITKITKDSLYVRFFEIQKSVTDYGGVYFDTAFRYTTAVHIKDIARILVIKKNSNKKRNGYILMAAGAGVMVLGAVNGAYRGDPPKDWYKPSGYIVAGALAATGFWMTRTADKKYPIGKKYQLKILELTMR